MDESNCPCIDASSALASLRGRSCIIAEKANSNAWAKPNANITRGVLHSIDYACVPLSFGSNVCAPHNLLHNRACDVVPTPSFCEEQWCYVDFEKCKKMSDEIIYRSDSFPDLDLFWSASTCDSTADGYINYRDDDNDKKGVNVLDGISITATIPSYKFPFSFKRDSATGDKIRSIGDEYYNNSIPYEGVYINYLKDIVDLSDGDIKEIKYVHRSRGSDILIPTSKYTAAVRDVQSGLSDMGVGPFWITAERLRMTAFTVPFVFDQAYLVVERPSEDKSLSYQTSKVFEPFAPTLWLLVGFTILAAALLSVWFMDLSYEDNQLWNRWSQTKCTDSWQEASRSRRAKIILRFCIDALIEKGMFFCGGGVSYDADASLPQHLLMFGFGFFILITVSSYVANLASFLSGAGVIDYIDSMEKAIRLEKTICAHPALKDELEVRWPKAKFVYHDTGNDYVGILDQYNAGACDVMAIGIEDTRLDNFLLEKFCERDLVYTDGLVLETPMAFPIRPDLKAGFSYWTYEGQRFHGISLMNSKRGFKPDLSCSVQISAANESGDLDSLSAENMVFPVIFFAAFAVAAAVLKLMINKKAGKEFLGRASQISLVVDDNISTKKNTQKMSMASGDNHGHRTIARGTIIDRDIELENLDDSDEFIEIKEPTSSLPKSTLLFPDDEHLQRILDNCIRSLQEVKEHKLD